MPLTPTAPSPSSAAISMSRSAALMDKSPATSLPLTARRKSASSRMPLPAALAWTMRPFASDKNHAGAQSIEDVGETSGFGLLEIDRLADMQCTANVRYDQRHASAHFVIDHSARLVADYAEQRGACRGPVDHRAGNVDPA